MKFYFNILLLLIFVYSFLYEFCYDKKNKICHFKNLPKVVINFYTVSWNSKKSFMAIYHSYCGGVAPVDCHEQNNPQMV